MNTTAAERVEALRFIKGVRQGRSNATERPRVLITASMAAPFGSYAAARAAVDLHGSYEAALAAMTEGKTDV